MAKIYCCLPFLSFFFFLQVWLNKNLASESGASTIRLCLCKPRLHLTAERCAASSCVSISCFLFVCVCVCVCVWWFTSCSRAITASALSDSARIEDDSTTGMFSEIHFCASQRVNRILKSPPFDVFAVNCCLLRVGAFKCCAMKRPLSWSSKRASKHF